MGGEKGTVVGPHMDCLKLAVKFGEVTWVIDKKGLTTTPTEVDFLKIRDRILFLDKQRGAKLWRLSQYQLGWDFKYGNTKTALQKTRDIWKTLWEVRCANFGTHDKLSEAVSLELVRIMTVALPENLRDKEKRDKFTKEETDGVLGDIEAWIAELEGLQLKASEIDTIFSDPGEERAAVKKCNDLVDTIMPDIYGLCK